MGEVSSGGGKRTWLIAFAAVAVLVLPASAAADRQGAVPDPTASVTGSQGQLVKSLLNHFGPAVILSARLLPPAEPESCNFFVRGAPPVNCGKLSRTGCAVLAYAPNTPAPAADCAAAERRKGCSVLIEVRQSDKGCGGRERKDATAVKTVGG